VRIALLVTDLTPPRIGGISRVATSLAEQLGGMGHEVDVYCLKRSADLHLNKSYAVKSVQPKWVLYKDYPVVAFSFQAFRDLLKNHARKPYDVSHAMNFNNVGFIPLRKKLGRAGCAHVSTGFETTQMELKAKWQEFCSRPSFHNLAQIVMESLLAPWQRAYIGWADVITTEDEETRHNFIKMGLDKNKIHLIPSGIDYKTLSSFKDCTGTKLLLPEHQKIILCPGRVDPRKGSQYLLRAFALVASQLQGVQLVFAGGGRGSYLDAMKKMARALGIAERVTFTGKVEDLNPYYDRAHGVVIPSLSEGIPITLQEALVFKKPVLCSQLQGTYAWAKDLGSISWFPAGKVEALAQGLVGLAEVPSQKELERSALWMKKYDWAEVALAYLEVYKKAILLRKQVLGP
jgi:glycosyltransferase involved in cell wall biosynthesis